MGAVAALKQQHRPRETPDSRQSEIGIVGIQYKLLVLNPSTVHIKFTTSSTSRICMGSARVPLRSLRFYSAPWSSRVIHEPCPSSWRRQFSGAVPKLSGHNRWSKIKHDKARADARTSKLRTQLSSDIIIASRLGGPDPTLNPRLSAAIVAAKKGQLAKSSIEHAILKGQGKSPSGATLENLIIETMLPHGVAALLECQTDNKARTLQDIRLILSRAGAAVTPTAFLFEKKGRITFEEQQENDQGSKVGVDEALEDAIEAGADDVSTDEDGRLVIDTPPEDVMDVAKKLQEKLGLRVDKAEVVYDPNGESMVSLTPEQEEEVGKVLEALEEDPSLQNLYVNATSQSDH
ncbi:uncharacterized protein PV06_09609 [Exophiala oligosperma]|uniref:Transcriptional regulatory protein n=2 Tax=Chaetothyriales TaxID=34395 RepID=A0A0D2D642_9EURO|nr:uncharacterized protein PV06_09609 [Exophiala oligosperma]KAJ9638499.1 hypothetical protein H2204_004269 [Knufia peltigerae]KIW38658.1 hypothetical protein PV06_09609 [Exophiala oligosperma]